MKIYGEKHTKMYQFLELKDNIIGNQSALFYSGKQNKSTLESNNFKKPLIMVKNRHQETTIAIRNYNIFKKLQNFMQNYKKSQTVIENQKQWIAGNHTFSHKITSCHMKLQHYL